MHYNVKIEIERIRSDFVTQIELSSVGRCGRRRLVSPTFEQAIKDLTAAHDELLASAQAYFKASAPVGIVEPPPVATEQPFEPAQKQYGMNTEPSKPRGPGRPPGKRQFAAA
jgi:hypothetical protein